MAKLDLQLIDTEAAAEMLGRSPATLATLRVRGGGPPFVRLSARCVRYRVADLVDYVEERVVESTSDPAA
jgi:hypothetical protein